MHWTQIVGALAVLFVAFIAYMRASAALQAAETAKLEAGRRASGMADELRHELATLKQLVARLAAGERVTPAMVEDGQLWDDLDSKAAAQLVAAHPETFILDVRTPQETAAGIIENAVRIPMDELPERMDELPANGTPMLVYCAAGSRSAAVCEHLAREGFGRLHNLTDGFGSWSGPTARPVA